MTKQHENKFSKRLISVLVLSASVLGVAISGSNGVSAKSDKPGEMVKMSIALIGDMPYDATGQAQTPAVIAEINKSKEIKFALFDGDTMSGKGD